MDAAVSTGSTPQESLEYPETLHGSRAVQPLVGKTSLPFAIAGKTIYLVDNVLCTGRTIRAALDELSAHRDVPSALSCG